MSLDISTLDGIAHGAALVRNVAPPEAPLAWAPMLTFRADWHGTVQAAINAAAAAGGGRVEVPAGEWDESVTISTSNVELVGVSWASVLTSDNVSQVVRVDGSGVLSKIRIANLTIIGDYTKTEQKGIFFAGATDVVVEGCYIADCGDSGIMAGDFNEFRRAVIHGNMISHCGNFGVVLNADTTAGVISDIVVSDNYLTGFESVLYPAHAVYAKGGYRVAVTGNVCSDLAGTDAASAIMVAEGARDVSVVSNVCIDSPSGIIVCNVGTTSVAVTGNTCAEMAGGFGVYVYDGAEGVSVTGNSLRSGTGAARGIVTRREGSNRCSNVAIVGNHVEAFATGSCFLSGTDGAVVAGNTFDLTGNTSAFNVDVNGSTKVAVTANRIIGGERCVMVRDASSEDVTVSLNEIAGASNLGIRFDSAVTEAAVMLNDCRQHAGSGAAISIGSSSSWELLNIASGACVLGSTAGVMVGRSGQSLGFYGATPVARPTGVPVTAAGIHAALVALGLITA